MRTRDDFPITIKCPENKLFDLKKYPKIDLDDLDPFLIHRAQYLSDSLTRGLDLRLRDLTRSIDITKDRILCHKTVSVEGLRVNDRARELISEFGGGLCGRK